MTITAESSAKTGAPPPPPSAAKSSEQDKDKESSDESGPSWILPFDDEVSADDGGGGGGGSAAFPWMTAVDCDDEEPPEPQEQEPDDDEKERDECRRKAAAEAQAYVSGFRRYDVVDSAASGAAAGDGSAQETAATDGADGQVAAAEVVAAEAAPPPPPTPPTTTTTGAETQSSPARDAQTPGRGRNRQQSGGKPGPWRATDGANEKEEVMMVGSGRSSQQQNKSSNGKIANGKSSSPGRSVGYQKVLASNPGLQMTQVPASAAKQNTAAEVSKARDGDGQSLNCLICDKIFVTEFDFDLHLTMNHFKDKLMKDIKEMTSKDGKIVKCKKCGYTPPATFKDAESKANDMLLHFGCVDGVARQYYELQTRSQEPPANPTLRVCKICNDRLRDGHLFMYHLCFWHFKTELESLVGNQAPYKCPMRGCRRVEKARSQLVFHFGVDHKKVLELYDKYGPQPPHQNSSAAAAAHQNSAAALQNSGPTNSSPPPPSSSSTRPMSAQEVAQNALMRGRPAAGSFMDKRSGGAAAQRAPGSATPTFGTPQRPPGSYQRPPGSVSPTFGRRPEPPPPPQLQRRQREPSPDDIAVTKIVNNSHGGGGGGPASPPTSGAPTEAALRASRNVIGAYTRLTTAIAQSDKPGYNLNREEMNVLRAYGSSERSARGAIERQLAEAMRRLKTGDRVLAEARSGVQLEKEKAEKAIERAEKALEKVKGQQQQQQEQQTQKIDDTQKQLVKAQEEIVALKVALDKKTKILPLLMMEKDALQKKLNAASAPEVLHEECEEKLKAKDKALIEKNDALETIKKRVNSQTNIYKQNQQEQSDNIASLEKQVQNGINQAQATQNELLKVTSELSLMETKYQELEAISEMKDVKLDELEMQVKALEQKHEEVNHRLISTKKVKQELSEESDRSTSRTNARHHSLEMKLKVSGLNVDDLNKAVVDIRNELEVTKEQLKQSQLGVSRTEESLVDKEAIISSKEAEINRLKFQNEKLNQRYDDICKKVKDLNRESKESTEGLSRERGGEIVLNGEHDAADENNNGGNSGRAKNPGDSQNAAKRLKKEAFNAQNNKAVESDDSCTVLDDSFGSNGTTSLVPADQKRKRKQDPPAAAAAAASMDGVAATKKRMLQDSAAAAAAFAAADQPPPPPPPQSRRSLTERVAAAVAAADGAAGKSKKGRRQADLSHESAAQMLKTIKREAVDANAAQESVCHVCFGAYPPGVYDEDDDDSRQWFSCSKCPRCYHKVCVPNASGNTFVCESLKMSCL